MLIFSDHFRIVFLLEENICSLLSFLVWGVIVEVSCLSSEEIIEWDWGAVLGCSCECKQAGADCDGSSQTSENEWKTQKHQNGNRRRNKEISSAIWRKLELKKHRSNNFQSRNNIFILKFQIRNFGNQLHYNGAILFDPQSKALWLKASELSNKFSLLNAAPNFS